MVSSLVSFGLTWESPVGSGYFAVLFFLVSLALVVYCGRSIMSAIRENDEGFLVLVQKTQPAIPGFVLGIAGFAVLIFMVWARAFLHETMELLS